MKMSKKTIRCTCFLEDILDRTQKALNMTEKINILDDIEKLSNRVAVSIEVSMFHMRFLNLFEAMLLGAAGERNPWFKAWESEHSEMHVLLSSIRDQGGWHCRNLITFHSSSQLLFPRTTLWNS